MKKITTFLFLAIGMLVQAQEQSATKPDFGLTVNMFSGNAILQQNDQVDQNSFIRDGVSLEFDVKWNGFGVYAGLGTYQLTANRVLNGQSTFLKQDYLFLPFGITSQYPILKKAEEIKLAFQIDFGGYAGHLWKTQENTVDLTFKDKNVGWNFGFMGRIGVSYKLYHNIEMKAGLQVMSDLSKIDTQKVTKSSMYFISAGYRF